MSVEYNAQGVVIQDQDSNTDEKPKRRGRVLGQSGPKRKLYVNSPKIYVNDGSNGTNLQNTYSYKNYCNADEKPSVTNNYSNSFNRVITSNATYDAVDGLRLHPTGDSGGYSNFTISQYVK